MVSEASWDIVSVEAASNPKVFIEALSESLNTQTVVEQLVATEWLTEGEGSAILDAIRDQFRERWGFEPWNEVP